jgi:riboflavin synthase
MFTGIIQESGILSNINLSTNLYTIKTKLDLNNTLLGASISCDGVCLTVINIKFENYFYFFDVNIGEETIKRSTLSDWVIGSNINLEKSLKVGDEISGHFVYGHVDMVIKIIDIKNNHNSWDFEFSLSNLNKQPQLKKLLAEKGSVSINGISLTVANVSDNSFNVSVIPHTFDKTNLSSLKTSAKVNLEFDIFARYISRLYEK